MLILALPLFQDEQGRLIPILCFQNWDCFDFTLHTSSQSASLWRTEVRGTLNVTPVSVASGHFGDLNVDSNRGPPPSGTGFSDDTRIPDREKTEHLV